MKTTKSFNVNVYCGLKERYSETVHTIDDVMVIVDEYVNSKKDCVTVTKTEYRYVNGNEPGVIVGFINYPRFPREESDILQRALYLAGKLMYGLNQYKVSVVTNDITYMLENDKIN